MVIFNEELIGYAAEKSGRGYRRTCNRQDHTDIGHLCSAELLPEKESFRSNWRSLNTDCQGSQDLENLLSRLGGGIGTRGPGEKKLETDRRHIERRMNDIKDQSFLSLKAPGTSRGQEGRKTSIPVVALVGYTNSGKSSYNEQDSQYVRES